MSNLVKHAERELKLAGIHEKDADYGGMLYNAVMELVEVFSKQDHSGASASRVTNLFDRVARYENLAPLTGEDSEWADVEHCFQNNRVSSVFKDKKDSEAYYIDAIVWRTQKGGAWSGGATMKNGKEIRSRQYVKSFPFTPKTFYIDVIEMETSKDNWVFLIKDEKQLEEVWEYYNKFTKGE